MTTPRALPTVERPRHGLTVAALLAVVLAGHAWLLGRAGGAPGELRGPAPEARAVGMVSMRVRHVAARLPTAPPRHDPAAGTAPTGPAAPVGRRSDAGLQRPPGDRTADASLVAAASGADAEAGAGASGTRAAARPAAADASLEAAAQAASGPVPNASATPVLAASGAGNAPPVPVYATQLPPPFVAQFAVQGPNASGTAELSWQSDGRTYRLRMSGARAAMPGATWSSQGGLDEYGIAPERYAESRRGREHRAANFQREAGRITFSGPAVEYPLVPGAQDRLSWLVQLGAVLNANPALAEPGAEVSLFVVGTRGDARVWVFKVLGQQNLADAKGPAAAALHLRREPQVLYDTEAEVWLDPARHHLPLRVQLRVRPGGEGTVYSLQALQLPAAATPPP